MLNLKRPSFLQYSHSWQIICQVLSFASFVLYSQNFLAHCFHNEIIAIAMVYWPSVFNTIKIVFIQSLKRLLCNLLAGHTRPPTYGTSRSFKCDLCDYAIKIAGNMIRHLLLHKDGWPFQCDYNCVTRYDLKKHLDKHKDERLSSTDVQDGNLIMKFNHSYMENHKGLEQVSGTFVTNGTLFI